MPYDSLSLKPSRLFPSRSTIQEVKLDTIGNAGVKLSKLLFSIQFKFLSVNQPNNIKLLYYITCVCSRMGYNVLSDWLIVGHYSPARPTSRLRACKGQAKSKILNNFIINLERWVFTGKSQSSALPYWPRCRSVNTARFRSEIFP